AFQAGSASAGGGFKGAAAGVGNVAKTGAQAAGQKVADGARSMKERVAAAFRPDDAPASSGPQSAADSAAPTAAEQPAWAKRLHRRQQLTHAATTAAHTLRGGDGGSSSQGPSLRDSDS
ncbi:TPA: P-type conjugative transfer protein TrbL, partial [Pseudomonas aeruginosa]